MARPRLESEPFAALVFVGRLRIPPAAGGSGLDMVLRDGGRVPA